MSEGIMLPASQMSKHVFTPIAPPRKPSCTVWSVHVPGKQGHIYLVVNVDKCTVDWEESKLYISASSLLKTGPPPPNRATLGDVYRYFSQFGVHAFTKLEEAAKSVTVDLNPRKHLNEGTYLGSVFHGYMDYIMNGRAVPRDLYEACIDRVTGDTLAYKLFRPGSCWQTEHVVFSREGRVSGRADIIFQDLTRKRLYLGDWKRHATLAKQLKTCRYYVDIRHANALLYGSYLEGVKSFISNTMNPELAWERSRLLPWMGESFDYQAGLKDYIHQLGTYVVLLAECEPAFIVDGIAVLIVLNAEGDWYLLFIPMDVKLRPLGCTLRQQILAIIQDRKNSLPLLA